MTELRSLNISFNRLTRLEGISSLKKLTFLELGKNFIQNVDALVDINNPLLHLHELYLYMNELRSLPTDLSFL